MRASSAVGYRLQTPPWASLCHVIHNGQSLSNGTAQPTAVSTKQPYANVKLFDSSSVYDTTLPNAPTLSMVPLIAPQRPEGTGTQIYPLNVNGESAEVSAVNMATKIALAHRYKANRYAASCTGTGAAAMVLIKKGTVPYAAGIMEMKAFARLNGAGSFALEAVILTHGEADANPITGRTIAQYQGDLVQMQADYQGDYQAFFGVSGTVPLIVSQQNSIGPWSGACTTGIAMLLASQANPLIVLMGPKYQYGYIGDAVHLANYVPLGEKYGQVLWALKRAKYGLGPTWAPLQPIAFSRSVAVVTMTFNVPKAPMVFDATRAPPHTVGSLSLWAPGKGFEAYDNPVNILTATNATPIVLGFDAPHGRTTGDQMGVYGVNGNTNANGIQTITVVDSTHVSLNGTTGNGAFAGSPGGSVAFSPIGIVSATINANQVTLTLARAPTTGLHVTYAMFYDSVVGAGFGGGRCGLLRDSDPFTGPSGVANQNWCVAFDQAVA